MNIAAGKGDAQLDRENERLWHITIPDANDVIIGELAEPGDWIVANIQSDSFWPVETQKVMYRGQAFWILPLMKGFYPAVVTKVTKGKGRHECEKLVMRFVSNLSWVEDRGFIVEGLGGGSRPTPMGRDKERGFCICNEFDLSYFPEPASDDALLALALMREGRGLNHPAYAFLSFFRVLEVAFPDRARCEKWVNANLGSVRDHGVAEALTDLQARGVTDIGGHLS